VTRPTIFLFADVLGGYGGIESYLDALARRLASEGWPVQVAVSLNAAAPFLDDLEAEGVGVFRQPVVPGDRLQLRQRLLIRHVARRVRPGDWVFCVRQPMAEIYPALARSIHRRGGRLAASWMFAPEFLPAPRGRAGAAFRRAVRETDSVISVAECTRGQFRQAYGFDGPVKVVRYHNIDLFGSPTPLPPGPPWAIGFIGRIDIHQKNLDTILSACAVLAARRDDVVFNFHGGGPDLARFRALAADAGLAGRVTADGPYDRRHDLPRIIARNHLFIYTSRFEGGPCLSLIELLQAGRYVVASPVGGIPDIYAGRPEIGELVAPDDPHRLADAFERGLCRIQQHAVDPKLIRSIYLEHFSDSVAHGQWLAALDLADSRQGRLAS